MGRTFPAAILFDLDGTLVDSREDLAAAVNAGRGEYGLPSLSVETVTGYVGDGMAKLVERSFAEIVGEVALDALVAAVQSAYARCALERTVPYPGIPEVLTELRAGGVRLAVVSNKPEAFCLQIVNGLGLDKWIEVVVGGDTVRATKPDPAPVLEALRRLNTGSRNAWLVGDNWTDLDAARAAGVRSCFCCWGFGRRRGRTADAEAVCPADLLRLGVPSPTGSARSGSE